MISFSFFKKKQFGNISEVVATLVAGRYLSDIAERLATDPREIFEVAGLYYPGGKLALLEAAAAILDLPAVRAYSPLKGGELRRGFSFEAFKRYGVYPVGQIAGADHIFAVDPIIARKQLEIPPNIPIAVACWSEIQLAWQAYEDQQPQDLKVVERADLDLPNQPIEPARIKRAKTNLSERKSRRRHLRTTKVKAKKTTGNSKEAAGSQSEPEENTARAPLKICLIDDSQVFSSVLQRYLANERYDFVIYSDSKAALEALQNQTLLPDLIVCDLHMPAMSGEELLRAIRSSTELAELPFVLLTSDTEVETKLDLITAGADAFIGKNEDPRIITAQVEALIARTQRVIVQ